MVSASHNPFADNGIKFFGPDGTKLSDEEEARVEAVFAEPRQPPAPGRVRELHGAAGDYLRELEMRFEGLDLSGKRVLLDCANGATYRVAPEIFRRLGADVTAVAVEPDGRNINDGCGSTHIAGLADAMRDGGFDIGFAFDGDGDRALAVDREGAVVDGDELIALAALHLRETGRLAGDGVAVTVMTNYGFHQAMERAGISVATTPVGDLQRAGRAAPAPGCRRHRDAGRLHRRVKAVVRHHRHRDPVAARAGPLSRRCSDASAISSSPSTTRPRGRRRAHGRRRRRRRSRVEPPAAIALGQAVDVRRAAAGVDVAAVGLVGDDVDVGAEPAEDLRARRGRWRRSRSRAGRACRTGRGP